MRWSKVWKIFGISWGVPTQKVSKNMVLKGLKLLEMHFIKSCPKNPKVVFTIMCFMIA